MRKVVTKTLAVLAGGMFSAAALTFVQTEEGLRTKAYRDQGGLPTICYGHTRGVDMGDEHTPEECAHMLEYELGQYVKYVDLTAHRKLPDEMRISLASHVYNVGKANYSNSTLLRHVRAGHLAEACEELPKWVYVGHAGHKVQSQGLIERRAAERELCLIGANREVGRK